MQSFWLAQLCHPSQQASRGQQHILVVKNHMQLSTVRWYCQNAWPSTQEVVKPYWEISCSLSLCDDLLLYNDHIVVARGDYRDCTGAWHIATVAISHLRGQAVLVFVLVSH